MKYAMTVAALILISGGLANPAAAENVKFVEYKNGYAMKILRISKIKQFHFVFQDFKSFEMKFDTSDNRSKFYKGPKIDEARFRDNIVIGVLKIGKAKFQITPQKVTLSDGLLQVHYKTAILRKEGLIRSQRLLLSAPKAGVKAVQFIENEKAVHKTELE